MSVHRREKIYISKKTGKEITRIWYDCMYYIGTKKKCKSFKENEKKKADLFDAEMKVNNSKGYTFEPSKIIFNDLIDEWQESTKNSRKPKTKESDDAYLPKIRQELGSFSLKNLNNPKKFKDFYNHLEHKEKYSNDKVHRHYKIVNVIMNYAKVTMQYVQYNYNEGLYKKDNSQNKDVLVFTDEEIAILMNNLQNECLKYRALIQVGFETFARRGELTGLEWSDIDWKNNRVSINKQTQTIKGKGIIEVNYTKTDSSTRINDLTPKTMLVLKLLYEEQQVKKATLGDKWENCKKIFINNKGGYMHPKTPYDILKKLEKNYNINEDVSFHQGIRHSSISWALTNNEISEFANISEQCGHKNPQITMRIYAHSINKKSKNISNTFENKLYSCYDDNIDVIQNPKQNIKSFPLEDIQEKQTLKSTYKLIVKTS